MNAPRQNRRNNYGRGDAFARPCRMCTHAVPEDEYDQRRLAEIRREISARVEVVTSSLTQESRDELLNQMALLQWNAERRARVRSRSPSITRDPDAVPGGDEQPSPDAVAKIE